MLSRDAREGIDGMRRVRAGAGHEVSGSAGVEHPRSQDSITIICPSAQTGQTRREIAGERLGAVAIVRRGRRVCGRRDRPGGAEELPTAGELVSAMASAEEAVIANAVEAGRQHVQQKAADEFRRRRASWSSGSARDRPGSPCR